MKRSSPALDASSRSGLIDSWRALACLAVVAYHGSEAVNKSPNLHPFVSSLAALAHYGWLGVHAFFVLSGYCLAQTLERRAQQSGGPLVFWRERLLRIYPAYWAALFLSLALALIATHWNGLPASSALPAGPWAWFSNLALITGWTGVSPRLLVSWSLDFEIGFYLLVGFTLLTPSSRPGARFLVYAFITLLSHIPGLVNWVPILSIWSQFACGIAVFAARNQTLPPITRIAAVGYPLALAAASLADDGGFQAFAPLFALTLLATLSREPRNIVFPRPLTALGVASYSIYLVHVPFMSPALNLARRIFPESDAAFPVLWIGHMLLGIAAGCLFHRWVERPLEKVRARMKRTAPDCSKAAKPHTGFDLY